VNEGGLGFPLFEGVWGFSVFSPSPLKRAIEGGRERVGWGLSGL
jgi:hypothetical protein